MAFPSHNPRIDCNAIQKQLLLFKKDTELFQQIVNAPFDNKIGATFLFLGIIVLLLVNERTGSVDRIALSDTEFAKNTTAVSVVPFKKIKIPFSYPENIISQAIQSGEPRDTTDWKFLFAPSLNPEQARINQASAGIAYSAVYPLQSRSGGALIFSYYQYQQAIGPEQRDFMQHYATMADDVLKKLPASIN